MADSKLADLTAITTPATTDILYLVHDPAGTPVDRKVTVADLRGASGLVHAQSRRPSGDLTLNSTSWANVDTGLDLTIPATAGDEIEVTGSWLVSASGTAEVYFDAVSVVSGSPVNAWGTDGAETGTTEGIQAWRAVANNFLCCAAGGATRPVVSGDLSGGNLTLRLRYRISSSSRTMFAGANRHILFSAKNLGQ